MKNISDPKRRGALKTIVATTLLTTATNPLMELLNTAFGKKVLVSSEAKADDDVEYPPGITVCRDKALKEAYYVLKTDQDYRVDKGKIIKGIIDREETHYCGIIVNANTPYIEPAYWFVCRMYGWCPARERNKLKEENLPLYYLSEGIDDYFIEAVGGYTDYYYAGTFKDRAINNCLIALFMATYAAITKSIKECKDMVKEYNNATDIEKKNMLLSALNIIKNRSMDKKSEDPMNGYNRALVVTWSAAVLWSITPEKEQKMIKDIYKKITLELEKLDSGFTVLARGSKGKKVSKWDVKSSKKSTYNDNIRYFYSCYIKGECHKHFE